MCGIALIAAFLMPDTREERQLSDEARRLEV